MCKKAAQQITNPHFFLSTPAVVVQRGWLSPEDWISIWTTAVELPHCIRATKLHSATPPSITRKTFCMCISVAENGCRCPGVGNWWVWCSGYGLLVCRRFPLLSARALQQLCDLRPQPPPLTNTLNFKVVFWWPMTQSSELMPVLSWQKFCGPRIRF